MRRKTRAFSEDFKKETIRHIVEANKTMLQASKDLDIGLSTLHSWKYKYHPTPEKLVEAEQKRLDKQTPLDKLKKVEKAHLKKIRDLEEENEILKKAMSIFAAKGPS